MTLPVIHPSHSQWTRERMPQIENVAQFEHELKSAGIEYSRSLISAKHLHATQNEVNLALVFKLIKAGLDTAKYPVIVSSDNHILDGHNRWYAAQVLMIDVHVIRVNREINSLLRFALALPEVKHSSVSDTHTHAHA